MIRKNIFSILIIICFLILGLFLFQEEIEQELKKLGFDERNKEKEIKVLNIHSHPRKNEDWKVSFQTKGSADLKIIPGDEQTINDLEFVSLFCGKEKRVPQILQGDVIFYPDWSCDEDLSSLSHLVNVADKHNLKFQFGGKTAHAFNSPDGWIGFGSGNLLDYSGGAGLEEALDGAGLWVSEEPEEHWFRIDLGSEYNITAVRGRSDEERDPVQVSIYVSNDPNDWGTAVAENINTWQDTADWQEVDTTDKLGRYIKVVIIATEEGDPGGLTFGTNAGMTIFDAYEEEPAAPAETILVFNQEWSTSSSWSYGSGTDLTSNASTSVELDLPKPTSRFCTSSVDSVYWGIGIPSTTSLGVYSGTTTFEAKAD